MNALQHAHFSHAVRRLCSFKETASVFDVQRDDQRACHRLECPANPFYAIWVSFQYVVGRPDLMRVNSGNWKAEDEVNGVYSVQDARRMYADLISAGFRPF